MPSQSARTPRRFRRSAALACAVAVVAAVAGPAATAYAAPAPTRASAPASVPTTDSPVVKGVTTLDLNADLGLSGRVSLKVGGGKVIHSNKQIHGGTILLNGDVVLKGNGKSAKVTNLSVDIASGLVKAKINGSLILLGKIDTSTLRLRSNPGDKHVYVNVGFSDENNIELTAEGAAKLSGLLSLDLNEGDVLLTGVVAAGLNLDAKLAADLNVDLEAIVEAGVDVDVSLDTDIDVSLDLDLGLSLSLL